MSNCINNRKDILKWTFITLITLIIFTGVTSLIAYVYVCITQTSLSSSIIIAIYIEQVIWMIFLFVCLINRCCYVQKCTKITYTVDYKIFCVSVIVISIEILCSYLINQYDYVPLKFAMIFSMFIALILIVMITRNCPGNWCQETHPCCPCKCKYCDYQQEREMLLPA